MKWLLKLYPPAWQRRYRQEVESLLEPEAKKIRTSLDLLAGAIDAWLNPKWIPKLAIAEGEQTMITASRCGSVEISTPDAARSTAWMLGITFILTSIGVVLDKTIGPHIMAKAMLYSAFFVALTISFRNTYLKPYFRGASTGIIFLICIGWYLFFLFVALIAKLT